MSNVNQTAPSAAQVSKDEERRAALQKKYAGNMETKRRPYDNGRGK